MADADADADADAESPPMVVALPGLPDPCLLAVLHCLAADDQRSLFSAARTHSRLHQAAVAALHSITVRISNQPQMDSVLLYLDKHGQHVDSIQLIGVVKGAVDFCQLPSNLQLSSMELGNLCLQLQPGGGFRGVLGAAAGSAGLKRLKLSSRCQVLDGDAAAALAAALLQLPAGLEHLSISGLTNMDDKLVQFAADVLPRLQQLTYLELARVILQGPGQGQPALQPLQDLTGLQDLRLFDVAGTDTFGAAMVTACMLSGMQHLTRLELSAFERDSTAPNVEPSVLAGKPQLQHLKLFDRIVSGGAAGAAELLSHLQPLQQLTHLDLRFTTWKGTPPAAAFAALTASSKLQYLDIGSCTLPEGAWQHIFPSGRQLQHLTSLNIGSVHVVAEALPRNGYASAPDGSRLVSCCPGLQALNMGRLRNSMQLLAPLRGLSGLHTLCWTADEAMPTESLGVVCQLTRLRELIAVFPQAVREELLLPLTQLQQLTSLTYWGWFNGGWMRKRTWTNKAPGDAPVWRQVLRLHLDHSDPAVVQQAAAALAK